MLRNTSSMTAVAIAPSVTVMTSQRVHIHAGDEIPVPRREAQREAGFRHGFIAAGLGPEIVDVAAAVVIACVDDIGEEVIAGRVGELSQVFADQFRFDRVH
jgi:hypothetical protein